MSEREVTIRGVLRALGLQIGEDELDGRWGVNSTHRWIPLDDLGERAIEAESEIQSEELHNREYGI